MFRSAARAAADAAAASASKSGGFKRKVKFAGLIVGVPVGCSWAVQTSWKFNSDPFAPVEGAALPLTKEQYGSYDVAVVGGGIIGLATAREVLRRFPNKTVVVLEREGEVAAHQTGHNSGVIHAGMYYEPGTKMAKCCVEGAAMMYAYAEEKKIPHERVGKLICAPTEKEHGMVEKLYKQGTTNGVKDLRVLYREQIKEIEPNVDVYSALESPNTGVIDYGDVARSLAQDIKATGRCTILLRYQVAGIKATVDDDGGKLAEISGCEPRQYGPSKVVTAKNVLTCAGVHMDHVARMAGGAAWPQVMTFRGRYYQMKPEYRNVVKRNIYPVPSGGGIPVGVHFTPTVGGYRGQQMIIGPGACMAFSKDGYEFFNVGLRYMFEALTNKGFWNFGLSNIKLSLGELVKDANKTIFLSEARLLVPGLTADMVEDSFTGVMAQVFLEDGSAAKDYIFESKCVEGTTLHLRNAPSPAATSSLAIAKELVNLAEKDFAWTA